MHKSEELHGDVDSNDGALKGGYGIFKSLDFLVCLQRLAECNIEGGI